MRVVRQDDALERFRRTAMRFAPRNRAARAIKCRERHVLDHRELAEGTRDLESAGEPQAADVMRGLAGDLRVGEADRAMGRLQGTGDQIEDRALARAVRPDKPENLAG